MHSNVTSVFILGVLSKSSEQLDIVIELILTLKFQKKLSNLSTIYKHYGTK